MKEIILASGSPRRRELLTQGNIPYEVIVSDAKEIITKNTPWEIVEELSCIKAMAVAKDHPDKLVLGADTIVALDGEVLGKPKDEQDAYRMLSRLQGNIHQVYTGVTFIQGDRIHSFHEKTDVEVYPMTEDEIWEYIYSKDPMDKAGSYGIQGQFAIHIRKINGDYNNVVGLPIGRVWQELKNF